MADISPSFNKIKTYDVFRLKFYMYIEEAKVRYRAVKIQPQWGVTPGKQTNKETCFRNISHSKNK
jgi:hypothetical protein